MYRNPVLKRSRRAGRLRATLDRTPVDDLSHEKLADNIIILGPMGAMAEWLGWHRSTHILYLLKDSDSKPNLLDIITSPPAESHETAEFFPIFSMRRAIGGPGTLKVFWTPSRGTRRFLKEIAAAVQYWVLTDKKEIKRRTGKTAKKIIMVTHMAVRKGWQRRKINTALLNFIQDEYPGVPIMLHELTDEGHSFMTGSGIGSEVVTPGRER